MKELLTPGGRSEEGISEVQSELDAYKPSPEQQERANILKRLVSNLERVNARYSIVGGYGLDGMYGRLTRDHNDIDVLSSPEDAEKVRKVIRAAGFRLDLIKIRGDVELYVHEKTDTKLDFSTTKHLEQYTEMNEIEFFSSTPNAVIEATTFRTPTIKGFEEFARIQRQRAEEGQWEQYAHAAWKSRLMEVVKERMKHKG